MSIVFVVLVGLWVAVVLATGLGVTGTGTEVDAKESSVMEGKVTSKSTGPVFTGLVAWLAFEAC